MPISVTTGGWIQEGADVYAALLKSIGTTPTKATDNARARDDEKPLGSTLQLRLRGVNDRLMLVERLLMKQVELTDVRKCNCDCVQSSMLLLTRPEISYGACASRCKF